MHMEFFLKKKLFVQNRAMAPSMYEYYPKFSEKKHIFF